MRSYFSNLVLILLLPLLSCIAWAGHPIKLGGDPIFEINHGIGAFTAQERAQAIQARIKSLAKDRGLKLEQLQVEEFENSTNIVHLKRVIVTITDRDAKAVGLSRQAYGAELKNKLAAAIKSYKNTNSWKQYALSVAYALLSTLILLFLLNSVAQFFPKVLSSLQNWSLKNIPSIKLKSYEVLPASRLVELIVFLFKASRLILVLFLVYLYIPIIFSFFPYTSGWADKIFGYVTNPLKNIAKVIIEYIPNLFFIAVILVLTNYLLRFLQFVFSEIERGSIRFSGFYQEWADPTYKLIRFLVFAFVLVIVFPYLPGSGSPAFQGVSVFLGVLLSLGSSSAIANIIGGIVLTYMRPFKIGDKVKIGETTGEVIEKSLLVTRVRTIKNVDITVPNAMVLTSHLVNYSSSARTHGLILHSSVTIGYDVDWRKVHQLLLDSTKNIEGLLTEPKPFVLQTSLDDFYVSYEINAYSNEPHKSASIFSELHKNIQDNFKAAGIEIMSPHFSAIRDGSQINIPSTEGTSPGFVPAFRFQNSKSDATL